MRVEENSRIPAGRDCSRRRWPVRRALTAAAFLLALFLSVSRTAAAVPKRTPGITVHFSVTGTPQFTRTWSASSGDKYTGCSVDFGARIEYHGDGIQLGEYTRDSFILDVAIPPGSTVARAATHFAAKSVSVTVDLQRHTFAGNNSEKQYRASVQFARPIEPTRRKAVVPNGTFSATHVDASVLQAGTNVYNARFKRGGPVNIKGWWRCG